MQRFPNEQVPYAESRTIKVCANVSRLGFVRKAAEQKQAQASRENLRIKLHALDDPITSLSGGNQQKVVLAKWLATGAPVLVLDNPTQGIDVSAKSEIYPLIRSLAARGKAVLVSSSEVAELQQVCDRKLVFYRCRIVAEIPNLAVNEESVMRHATGGSSDAKSFSAA